jgi:signal transduction histidine kinase
VFARRPDGTPRQVLGVSQDVTDRKAAEGQLKDADRRKDEFLATLAHELRNPLAPLRNGLQILKLAGADADAAAKTLAMMERQLGHMVRLIDDLLDVSRITRGKLTLRVERVALADVVAAAVETARPVIDAAGHELEVSLPPAPVAVDADPTRLAQVFANLLTNAAKYTDPGGRITLNAECFPMRNAECGMRNAECGIETRGGFRSSFRVPRSAFRIRHRGRPGHRHRHPRGGAAAGV